ncbi:TPA: type VI secretion system ImpA family N-terminal domain-containing protein [Escherichia coli]|nr:type VI secretion system ImpA family N-terminal domain-containing protein [Escherichia coli]HEL8024429.1 type VI secretion system ImpA family N-terminal domain-containing protein [Escherichia coli]HEL8043421.1 type VI secretion system ImpA family N-terminal domain-containing protein [Escherichia coli]HEL8049057.1 type VI secretion system ImpA family N-terminal domain-containing protein [Escherichia coli]HEL8053961.1 type VI secretion system ImpA family N-terminal domain-containing protein [E
MTSEMKLKTGGDPRSLPDYASLRDEISKLTHPARPDVDWRHVETLCLRLYEHNGVELQTVSWYTVARMHTAGLSGLNEGLALTVTLIRHHWSVMWPVNTHARLEIITGLVNRLQKMLRAMPPDERDSLPLLYQTETFLKALSDTLVRHELKQSSKVALLESMVKGYITRLENQPLQGEDPSPVTLPAQALLSVPPDAQEHEPPSHSRLVYVVSETRADIAEETTLPCQKFPHTFLKPFVAGVCAALLAVSVVIPGWQFLTQPSPAEQQLRALLTPPPDVLSADQLAQLRGTPSLINHAQEWTTLSGQQIMRLAELPPGYNLQRSSQLLHQLKTLFPDNPRVQEMADNWHETVNARALPEDAMNGWREGMMRLQQLAGRLNRLDEQRGKYMTVSELKTEIFGIMQVLNQYVPAEEQLRRYGEVRSQNGSEPQLKQTEMALNQLINRYQMINAGKQGMQP